MLRKSLNEADCYRKRVFVVFFLLAGTVAAGLGFLDHHRGTADVRTMLFFPVTIILTAQVTVAVVTWGVLAAMGKRILKAIELLSEK